VNKDKKTRQKASRRNTEGKRKGRILTEATTGAFGLKVGQVEGVSDTNEGVRIVTTGAAETTSSGPEPPVSAPTPGT
jgi:hypothetical protein